MLNKHAHAPVRHGRVEHSPEAEMRARRSHIRIVKRKLKQGRPGRLSNAPIPDFNWADVVTNSMKKAIE